MPLHIDGPQMGRLSDAIESAFPAPPVLQYVFAYKLKDSIWNYGGLSDAYPTMRFNIVNQYNARYQVDKLVVALLEYNPDNAELLEFAWKHQLLKRPSGSDGRSAAGDDSLERMLDPVRGFTDAGAFLRRVGQIVNCICRVAVPCDSGNEYGTGFLVGDDAVLTNYHVVQNAIKKSAGADRRTVRLLFDYRTDPDGQTISNGREYKLADDDDAWLIDSLPYHPDDLTARPIAENVALGRPDDFLDYALLRVAGKPGQEQIGIKQAQGGAARGTLALPPKGRDLAADFDVKKAAIFIFQHPRAEPLRLDWEKPAILGVNADRTRLFYDVNTQGGSSGSPCFNAKLDLIALHHAGGKDWPAESRYLYNQGIPIDKIRDQLEKRGKLDGIL